MAASQVQIRYQGNVYVMSICFAGAKLKAVLRNFPDGIIDWETVRALPCIESSPQQRAAIERQLQQRAIFAAQMGAGSALDSARARAVAHMAPVGRVPGPPVREPPVTPATPVTPDVGPRG